VVLARFPEEESIVSPGSHCRHCDHVLPWWENLPLLSWLLLRGRCRQCRAWIGIRYPLVELGMALLWIVCWLKFAASILNAAAQTPLPASVSVSLLELGSSFVFSWLLVALALLDAEFFWLPDWFTWPGIGIGFVLTMVRTILMQVSPAQFGQAAWQRVLAILAAAGLVLFIRLAYWLVRRVEGMGLGDAKLMAMLAAWLGLRGALECFVLSVFGACAAAIIWLAILAIRRDTSNWSKIPLPLGTFLCAAALSEIFYPFWLTAPMHLELLGLGN